MRASGGDSFCSQPALIHAFMVCTGPFGFATGQSNATKPLVTTMTTSCSSSVNPRCTFLDSHMTTVVAMPEPISDLDNAHFEERLIVSERSTPDRNHDPNGI